MQCRLGLQICPARFSPFVLPQLSSSPRSASVASVASSLAWVRTTELRFSSVAPLRFASFIVRNCVRHSRPVTLTRDPCAQLKMARPKVCVRGPYLPTDPSRTFPGAEGHRGVSVTALRPSTGSVQEDEEPVSIVGDTAGSIVHVHDFNICRPPSLQLPAAHVKTEHDINPALEEKRLLEKFLQDFIRRPPRLQLPAAHFKTEHDFNPALEEKPSLEAPVSATVYIFPGAEGQQATAPAVGPSTLAPVREELGHGAGGQTPLLSDVIQQQRARLQKENQGVIPAAPVSASISTAALVGKKPRGFKLSKADMVSDAHLLLTEKAHKLGLSVSCFRNRRRRARLGRWPGRKVRADMKREEDPARRA